MAPLKGFHEIRLSGSVKGFRSCRQCTGAPMLSLDRGRIPMGEARRRFSQESREWRMRGSLSPLRISAAAASAFKMHAGSKK